MAWAHLFIASARDRLVQVASARAAARVQCKHSSCAWHRKVCGDGHAHGGGRRRDPPRQHRQHCVQLARLGRVDIFKLHAQRRKLEPCKRHHHALLTVVTCMKLTSYALTNRELRRAHRKKIAPPPEAVGATVGDRPLVSYPDNLTAANLYAFMSFPTLVYALNYPMSPRVRKRWLARRLVELVCLSIIIVSMVEQWILPAVENANIHFDNVDVLMIIERVMKVSIPNIYVWLMGFYVFFHVYLNVIAEITRFGDRLFYKDWWNARTLGWFWRT